MVIISGQDPRGRVTSQGSFHPGRGRVETLHAIRRAADHRSGDQRGHPAGDATARPAERGRDRGRRDACFAAGATIVHHHTDEASWRAPRDRAVSRGLDRHPGGAAGRDPVPDDGRWRRAHTISERYAHVEELAALGLLRFALLDPGSVSLGPLDADGLPMAIDLVYQNTFADVRYMVDVCTARGLATHVSIFEPGFLRIALAYHARGRLRRRRSSSTSAATRCHSGCRRPRASLDAYLAMLEGTALPWMVGVIGGDVSKTLAELAIARGGHVRVGLEDYDGPDRPRNVELVQAIVALAKRAGRAIATPAEAAAILRLPPRP